MSKLYAKVAGAVLVLIGVVGLLAGEGYLFGVLNIDLFEDLFHLTTGTLLLYAGFGGGARLARDMVGILSLTYLLYGAVGFVYSPLLGLLPDPLTLLDNVFHLAVGAVGVASVALSRREEARKA